MPEIIPGERLSTSGRQRDIVRTDGHVDFRTRQLVRLKTPNEHFSKRQGIGFPALINSQDSFQHQSYLIVLDAVGERRVDRARSVILAQGLAKVDSQRGWALEFKGLRSSGVDFDELRRHAGGGLRPEDGRAPGRA